MLWNAALVSDQSDGGVGPGRRTWDHGVQGLQVFVGDAALVAHLVHEAVDEAHHRVGHVRRLGVLEAALRVVALRHAARDAAPPKHNDSMTLFLYSPNSVQRYSCKGLTRL